MKNLLKTIAIQTVFVLLTAGAAFSQTNIDKVKWLTGCWGGPMGGGQYSECWTTVESNFMQGSGRLVTAKGIPMREHMTIEVEGDAVIMYVLLYGAGLKAEQPAIGFKLMKATDNELVFENPKNDYPQRIIYLKNADGNIVARIEMLDGTKPMNFPMNRPGATMKK
jgi:hypothetical protein